MNSGHLITNSASISKQILLSAVRTQYAKRGQLIASIGDPGSTKVSLVMQTFSFLVINNNCSTILNDCITPFGAIVRFARVPRPKES